MFGLHLGLQTVITAPGGDNEWALLLANGTDRLLLADSSSLFLLVL